MGDLLLVTQKQWLGLLTLRMKTSKNTLKAQNLFQKKQKPSPHGFLKALILMLLREQEFQLLQEYLIIEDHKVFGHCVPKEKKGLPKKLNFCKLSLLQPIWLL